MKRLAYSFAVILFALVLAGCRTVGQDFDQLVITQIEKGKTTKSQIQDWLGTPYEKGLQGEMETWTYRFIKVNLTSEVSKELTVWFTNKDVVHTYSYTTNHAPWQISK